MSKKKKKIIINSENNLTNQSHINWLLVGGDYKNKEPQYEGYVRDFRLVVEPLPEKRCRFKIYRYYSSDKIDLVYNEVLNGVFFGEQCLKAAEAEFINFVNSKQDKYADRLHASS